MITSFSLYLGLMASFWCWAWLGLRLAGKRRRSGPGDEAPRGHFQEVDGLRGVLALSVLVHHAVCMRNFCARGAWTLDGDALFAQTGVYAVTLFFFITGFLFWSKLQKNPRPNIGQHVRSRVTRLVPAYWAGLLVMLLIVALHTPWTIQDHPLATLKNMVSWMLFTLPGLEDKYGGPIICSIYAGVTWTLRLEWMFYLIIPWCGWFTQRGWRAGLFLLLLLVLHVTVSILAMDVRSITLFPDWIRSAPGEITSYFAYCFAGGIAVAAIRPWLLARYPHVNFRQTRFSLLSVGLVVATLFIVPPAYGWQESVWLLGPFLLVVLGNDWFGFLTSAPALLLGKISYSVYLLHGMVLYLAYFYLGRLYPLAKISDTVYWAAIVVLGGVVIAVSALWYRLFEKPFMNAAAKPRPAAHPTRPA